MKKLILYLSCFLLLAGFANAGERVLTVGGNQASRPISDFLVAGEIFGPPAAVYYVDGNVSATGGGQDETEFMCAVTLSLRHW